MATLYADSTDNLIDIAKQTSASPNTTVVLNGTPISNQTLMSLAANQAMQGTAFANSVVPYAGSNFTGMNNNLGAQTETLSGLTNSPSQQSLANQATVVPVPPAPKPKTDAELLAISNPSVAFDSGEITPAELNRLRDLNTQRINAESAKNPQPQRLSIQDTPAELTDAQKAATLAASNTTGTKPSTDTLANLGGTGTAKVADTGTVIDNTKLNTQGGGSALATGDALDNLGEQQITLDPNTLALSNSPTINNAQQSAASQQTVTLPNANVTNTGNTGTANTGAANTGAAGTGAANTNVTPSGITLSDLQGWGDTLKSDILTGVDTKNKTFGTQATQGFMDAFKNFQIPTNQQTGVNLGNYNDNRNAAADQWWSQYVTGRR